MDGIEKIIGRINAAAADECAAIAQQAEKDCENIRAAYAQKVQSAYESASQSGALEIDLEAERVIRNAKLAARKDVLGTKQEMLDAAFESAKKKLAELPEEKYVQWLAELAARAGSRGELILSSRDQALGEKITAKANEILLSKGKKAELTLSKEIGSIDAGFILRDGRLEINCTLSAILEMNRQALAANVADMLFN